MYNIITYYSSRNTPNDTFVVALEEEHLGVTTPVDFCQYYREGNMVRVRGQRKDEKAAIDDAKATFRAAGYEV